MVLVGTPLSWSRGIFFSAFTGVHASWDGKEHCFFLGESEVSIYIYLIIVVRWMNSPTQLSSKTASEVVIT